MKQRHKRTYANDPGYRRTMRNCRLKHDYGITLEDYEALLLKQRGVCAICKKSPPTGKNLYVDHCHKTGKVRGLLHQKCNSAIGLLNDDPSLIKKAWEYLEQNG